MKFYCLSAIFFISSLGLAATKGYRIESQIYIDGKLVSSPTVITNGSEPAVIERFSENPQSALKMRVIASDATNEKIEDGIMMKFDVEYTSKSHTVKSSPQILAKAGSQATIEVGDKNGKVELKIVATRE